MIASLLGMHLGTFQAKSAVNSSFSNSWNTIVLSMDQGLPHNFVDDILHDSNGFMWLALQGGGLARYDGYNFLTFSPTSKYYNVKSTYVTAVAEDGKGRLWVGSDQGVDIIDLKTLANVDLLANTDAKLKNALSVHLTAVCSDDEGRIWIQSGNNIVCVWFDPDNGDIVGYAIRRLSSHQEDNQIFRSKSEHPSVYMFLGNNLKRLNVDQHRRIVDITVAEDLRLEPDTRVYDLVEQGNELWVATDRGLYRYDKGEHLVRCYTNNPVDTTSISQNCVTSLTVSPDHRIIAGTLRGLSVYNSIRDNFEQIYNTDSYFGAGRLINNNFIHCMVSRQGQIFIGTEGGGLNILVPRLINTRLETHLPGSSGTLSSLPVNSIYYAADGTEYVGTVEGGLNRRLPGSATYDHFTVGSGALSHNSVSSISSDSQGRLWVGTWGGGVNVLSAGNPAIRQKLIQTSPNGKDMSYIGVIIRDDINGGMWIGCTRGVWYYTPEGNLTNPIPSTVDEPTGLIGAAVDKRGHLWVGGSNGLYDIDLRSRDRNGKFRVRHLKTKLDNPKSNQPERVAYVHIDAKGILWVGSNGHGLYRREVDSKGNEKFVNYSTAQGLANNYVKSMLDDNQGNLWVGTYHGLSCITPDGKIVNYGTKDGLGSAQFYWSSPVAKAPDGTLSFCTVDGIIRIDGRLHPNQEAERKIRFTRLYVGNEMSHPGDGHTDEDISVSSVIRIHERDKSISIEFSALDYGHSSEMRYFYRLYPFEKEWIELPDGRNYVSYTNLPSGKFTFEVRYAPSLSEIEDAPSAQIEVRVSPYFYKTLWFYLLLTLLIVAIILLYIWYRTRHLTKENRQLEKMVEQRVDELKKADRERRQAEERVGEQQTQIADMTRRVNELTLDQISFFTNITHEFRTPITLIIGPIQRALRLSSNPKVIEQLSYVERNSKYLLSLVNQLMDFRKVESGKFDIVRTHGNIQRYADEIITPFEALASERGITIRRVYHLPHPVITFDEDALRKIFTNLLGNAVKFTPDDGEITVYMAVVGKGKDARLYIAVSDTGCGIPAEEIDNVFDRFFSGKSQMKYPVTGSLGSGIGLYLCKTIIDLYGGKIGVRNNRNGKGCTFRISLPCQLVEREDVVPALPVPDASTKTTSAEVTKSERPTVLVVEDNADMRSFISSILSDCYNVAEAENGEEALKVLLDRNVDFIVSDFMMPVMDGLELSRRVKENFAISHIPILMLTAKSGNDSRLESYRTGVDEFLPKPFGEEILLARIKNILDNKRRYQSKFNVGMDVDALNIADGSRDKRFIDEAMEVIKNNYKNSCFDIGDFAEALGISRSLLNKKLNSLCGQSAVHLIRNFRMNMARELIIRNRTSKAQNISEVAYEVGFNDPKYFTRCFTKHFGITPTAMLNGEDV